MFNLLKWDLINFINKNYRLYFGFAAVFIMTLVIPDNIQYLSAVMDGIAAIYSILFFGYTIFISATETIGWLWTESSQLTLSLSAKPWKILMSKLILSICINAVGSIFTVLLWSIIGTYGMSSIISFIHPNGFFLYSLFMLVLLITVMFSYISAKSYNFTRNKADATILVFCSIYTLLILLVPLFFIATGTWHVDSLYFVDYGGRFSVSANENQEWLQTTFGILYPTTIIAAGFWGSCSLFRRRFERY
ncbi:MAG TPA: hypothetical protein VN426_18260 [Syntrophomonadaceae bacterium]|nr:hypothetical protein [Syntrophomonadaceae bacterium]